MENIIINSKKLEELVNRQIDSILGKIPKKDLWMINQLVYLEIKDRISSILNDVDEIVLEQGMEVFSGDKVSRMIEIQSRKEEVVYERDIYVFD